MCVCVSILFAAVPPMFVRLAAASSSASASASASSRQGVLSALYGARFLSIREAGGKFSEREKALEDKYFHELEAKLLEKLSKNKEFIKKTAEAQAAQKGAEDELTPEQFEAFKKDMMEKLSAMEKKVKK